MKKNTKKRELPLNMPRFGLNYNAVPRWFRFDSMVPGKINFHKEVWEGVGNLNEKQVETKKFRSGESEKLWTFPQIEVCILAQSESLAVVHKTAGKREVEIPVPPHFSIDGHFVRTRTRLYVVIWTECGSLDGHVGVLTGRGKGYARRMGSILQKIQNSVVKPVQKNYPEHELSLSHFKIPLRAGIDSTLITSLLNGESSLVYLPELVLDFGEPSELLLSDKEMLTCAEEFKDAEKWVLAQRSFNTDVLNQYATEIGYQPVERLVNAALPSGLSEDDFSDGTLCSANLPSQEIVPTSFYD